LGPMETGRSFALRGWLLLRIMISNMSDDLYSAL
jgi:hypothetical protein